MGVEIDVKALREISVELRGPIQDAMAVKIDLVHRKVAMDVKRTMKAKAPVDTGAMMDSTALKTTGSARSTLTSTIAPTVEYTIYVNEGTHNEDGSVRMAARPFIDEAIEAHADGYFAALEVVVTL